jgi:hypothetical protein
MGGNILGIAEYLKIHPPTIRGYGKIYIYMWISNKDGLAFKPVKLGHKSNSSLDSQTQF